MPIRQDESLVNAPTKRKIIVNRIGNSRLEFFPKIVDQASVQYVVRTSSPNRQATKYCSKFKERIARILRENTTEAGKAMEGKIIRGVKQER